MSALRSIVDLVRAGEIGLAKTSYATLVFGKADGLTREQREFVDNQIEAVKKQFARNSEDQKKNPRK